MATVLVVEDKESLRAMLEETLRADGWGVVGAAHRHRKRSSGCAREETSISS